MTTPFITQGILIQDPTTIPFVNIFAPRSIRIEKNNWHYLLKSAIFRTFSKYTGFTSSLDMKMEADSLLWEKIDGGKFITKIIKRDDEDKSGMIVDMTRETGHLEFIQMDSPMYNLLQHDHKVLAYWKIKMLDPERVRIQVIIPQEPPLLHIFEFVPGYGLKEIKNNMKNVFNKMKNPPQEWKDTESKEFQEQAKSLSNPIETTKRQDQYNEGMRQYETNNMKTPREIVYRQHTPRTIIFKPTPPQYYPTYQPMYPIIPKNKYSPYQKQTSLVYYQPNRMKSTSEFKQDPEYNGFMPSVGSGGNQNIYESSVDPEYIYNNPHYYNTYNREPVTTYKPYPITFTFKPSTQFIQYSEPDPFYNSEENLTYIPLSGSFPILGNIQGVNFDIGSVPPTVPVEIYHNVPQIDIYGPEVTTIDSESVTLSQPTEATELGEQATLPTTINIDKEDLQDKEYTTTAMTKPTSDRSTVRGRIKNSARSPHTSSLLGAESYNYAPLYIRWGQKLKPSKNKLKSEENKTKETSWPYYKTQTNEASLSNNSIVNKTEETPTISITEETPTINTTEESTTLGDSTTFRIYETTTEPISTTLEAMTNITQINNRTGKSREEIVHDLTRIGLKSINRTNEDVNRGRVERILTNLKQYYTESPPAIDSDKEASEPISMVVNRISKSITYKTAEGHMGSIKQALKKN